MAQKGVTTPQMVVPGTGGMPVDTPASGPPTVPTGGTHSTGGVASCQSASPIHHHCHPLTPGSPAWPSASPVILAHILVIIILTLTITRTPTRV